MVPSPQNPSRSHNLQRPQDMPTTYLFAFVGHGLNEILPVCIDVDLEKNVKHAVAQVHLKEGQSE